MIAVAGFQKLRSAFAASSLGVPGTVSDIAELRHRNHRTCRPTPAARPARQQTGPGRSRRASRPSKLLPPHPEGRDQERDPDEQRPGDPLEDSTDTEHQRQHDQDDESDCHARLVPARSVLDRNNPVTASPNGPGPMVQAPPRGLRLQPRHLGHGGQVPVDRTCCWQSEHQARLARHAVERRQRRAPSLHSGRRE